MTILVTGAAGYIGSHTCVELLEAGYNIVALDNFSNSHPESLKRVSELTGKIFPIVKADLKEETLIAEVFDQYQIEAVIHFAAYKAVGESVHHPLTYYENNLSGLINLLKVMERYKVKRIVFSSSATVYGSVAQMPIRENVPFGKTSPYGKTKQMAEEILNDLYTSDTAWNITILRYFNPIGAHSSGRIGEDPTGTPNNLVPYISQVAIGQRVMLNIFGNDYETKDGTGVRDYIHISDLANGHLKAIEAPEGLNVYNLGTGCGYSVLEVVEAFEEASGKAIPLKFTARRPGDIAVCYADPVKAELELKWKATRSLKDMCEDTWRWQTLNPSGYTDFNHLVQKAEG
ncbi:UDP-glucose 4-epimerase GalE [Jeotgalibacillus haloalkalitolerans]|uniref:UDP-glucose 4-epimerase n=1 Tax=Jeotgalibacillus haloalkalitolerans TaxID=3104292 RepID=A0ABU5KI46_9BACL|nr:UDP-glucose 4-epimerase GalE [Jeotgalibacillus sp. HH7-29]MDZ5710901.1 UDP-glucose 4-epimerase GalE [Jeotgalibacillus sp. HH7-29]